MFLSILFLTLLQIPIFTFDAKLKNKSLVDYMLVLPDTAENLAFKDVLTMDNSFKKMEELPNILEMLERSYWIKIDIVNNTNDSSFVITTDGWDEVNLYNQFNDNWQVAICGRLTSFNKRELQYGRMINIPLKLKPKQKNTFYINLVSKTEIGYSYAKTYQLLDLINISDTKFIEKSGRLSMIFYAIIIGISFSLGFYNLIIYLFTREKSYLLLSLYLFGQTLFTFGDSGFSLEFLFLTNPEYNIKFLHFGMIFTWLTLILFAQNYLKLKNFFPLYSKYLTTLILIFAAINFLSILNIYKGLDSLSSLLILLLIFSLLFISIRTSLKGFKPAFFFLFADIFYIAGLFMVIVMNHFNMTLFEDFSIVNLPLNLGAVTQALLLSFGTAYKVDNMRNELKKSQEEHNNLINTQNERLEEEVQKKTNELQVQNEELLQQSEELQAQRDQLELINREVNIQRNQIKKSIHSASLTQQAILPEHEVFDSFFKDKFILYHPKDIVSGDFYWSEKVDNKLFLAVVDCTGHGVPGAMMSLIGGALLSKAINEQKLSNPSEILSMLNKSIFENLKQDKNKGMEGMDLSICIFHLDGSKVIKLEFAGAKSDLYHQNKKGLKIHKGNRHSIGGGLSGKRFDTYTISLEEGDTIYLTTDGYLDQNDRLRKRYGKKSFENLIRDIDKFDMQDKAKMLKNTLSEHQGKEDQRDDITLLALEV